MIFNVQHYDGNYETEVKKYIFSNNKIEVLTKKQTDTFYACSDKYVTTKSVGSVSLYDFGPQYMDIIVEDKDFKEIKKVFEKVNDEIGIILWPYTYGKVEVSDGKKNYIFDCNSNELKEISNMYTQVTIVE